MSNSNLKKLKKADLTLSCDVLYHLIEEEVYTEYRENLFRFSKKFVIILSSNIDQKTDTPHVTHRKFTDWVEKNKKDWEQIRNFLLT